MKSTRYLANLINGGTGVQAIRTVRQIVRGRQKWAGIRPVAARLQQFGYRLWDTCRRSTTRLGLIQGMECMANKPVGEFEVYASNMAIYEQGGVMSATSARSTSALFGLASRNSQRVISPINDCALRRDLRRPAFYCVHSVSGVAGTDFLDLAERLGPSIRFYGIQAPSRLMEDVEFGNSLDSLAEYYTNALVEFQPVGPVVLGGWCVGAVIALAMAQKLRARGREVGPLVAIDGVPENIKVAAWRWEPKYIMELLRNLYGWLHHSEVMRTRSLQSLVWSIAKNLSALGKGMLGLDRARKIGGGYAIESIMDVSRFQPIQVSFINRLFNALFAYNASKYPGHVVVYEAAVKPLLQLPQVGRKWRKLAPNVDIVEIVGTHITMMREPYVDVLAKDLRERIEKFFGVDSASKNQNS